MGALGGLQNLESRYLIILIIDNDAIITSLLQIMKTPFHTAIFLAAFALSCFDKYTSDYSHFTFDHFHFYPTQIQV